MLSEYDHEALRAAGATAGGYGLILLTVTVLLFGLPYAVFLLL